jgi:hypothetical protein
LEDPEWQEYIEVAGARPVLDFPRLGPDPGDPDPLGAMQSLTDDEVNVWRASGRPIYAEWIDA